MKVSLVATVKDAREHVGGFLASIRAQTRPPDEVVIVDGGSTDGTLEVLERTEGIHVISDPGANIARGRNLAARAAAHDVIAVSDADCVLAPDWLARIVAPIERGEAVVAGAYRPIAESLFAVATTAHIADPDELRHGWLPSARSLAFTRAAFEEGGGFPEWLDIGEDMYLNLEWVRHGIHIELAPDAMTSWPVRPTLGATWHQYARYAAGDAKAGMYRRRHVARFAAYGFGLAAVVSRNRWLLGVAAAGTLVYVARPLRRAWRRLTGHPVVQAASVTAVPAATAFIDAAKMWGYLRGLARRPR
jgi:glycosyltransferase involved in cell wall biosynthesis